MCETAPVSEIIYFFEQNNLRHRITHIEESEFQSSMLLVIGFFALLDKTFQRNMQSFPKLADHWQSQRAFTIQHFGDAPAVTDIRFQIFSFESRLFQAKEDCLNRVGWEDRMMPGLISLDQRDKYIQLIAFRCIGFSSPQCFDLSQSSIIVALGFDGLNFHCSFLLLALQVKFVVLRMGTDKLDEHCLSSIVNINDQPVFVPSDIKDDQ